MTQLTLKSAKLAQMGLFQPQMFFHIAVRNVVELAGCLTCCDMAARVLVERRGAKSVSKFDSLSGRSMEYRQFGVIRGVQFWPGQWSTIPAGQWSTVLAVQWSTILAVQWSTILAGQWSTMLADQWSTTLADK